MSSKLIYLRGRDLSYWLLDLHVTGGQLGDCIGHLRSRPGMRTSPLPASLPLLLTGFVQKKPIPQLSSRKSNGPHVGQVCFYFLLNYILKQNY